MNLTLEEQIDEICARPLPGYSGGRQMLPIVLWHWRDGFGDHNGHSLALRKIHLLIQRATLVECLTSPSEYIRGYRKWWEDKEIRNET